MAVGRRHPPRPEPAPEPDHERSDAARQFARDVGGPVITKSLGAPVDTVVIDPEELDDSVRLCAHLFQEWVEKVHEIRLTVVSGRFFAVEIHAGSPAARIDWRTDYKNLTYKPTTVPEPIRKRVKAFMEHFGIVFGAFDFIVTPTGAWRFLEVNSNGQRSWIESKTGVPISGAIADLLEKGSTP